MAKKISNQSTGKQETGSITETLFIKLERWFGRHDKKVFYSLLFFSTVFSLLLFDSKVTEGGDDSGYIERAWNLLYERKFPYYQGPGYPIILALIVKFTGLKVIPLKLFSVVCQLGFVFFTYKAFHKRIPFTVLFALISFISFNHFIQYYASQTFTETFVLFLQSIALYITFKIIDSVKEKETWVQVLKENYMKWIGFGLIFLFLSISKSIAIVCIVGVVLYFLLKKNFKYAAYAFLAFGVMRILYSLIVTNVYGPSDSDQFEMILRKELYNPGVGHEDFSGLVKRFFSNLNIYISLHMFRLMNLRNASTEVKNVIPALSFISSLVIIIFTIISYKKNRYVFFSAIYFIILCFGVFVGIQAANMQDRLIIVAIPLIFLLLYFGAYQVSMRSSLAQGLFIIASLFMLVITIGRSTMIANENIPALKRNLSGDIYYGYTPDWQNFLKMSKYCADSLPEGAQVLSRKPNMSFLYGNGKKFVGQFWVTTTNPDSVQMEWKAKNIRYVMIPNIRQNPKKNNGKVINTIHRMIVPFYKKYPQKVKLVKTIGKAEKCELFEITY
ncbi:MAG: hypothetical protein K0S44_3001 [Bacteroidetes bacterium]|jgi:hypothetical protein|nr:hypothetical protein [Bacteroidota bacterium]